MQFNWTNYFFTGMMALVVSWAMTLSGCRFGNQVQSVPQNKSSPLTGYYEMKPQKLTFCTTLTSGEAQCKNVVTNRIPRELSKILTNPVIFEPDTQIKNAAYLYSPFGNGKSALPVWFDNNLNLEYTSAHDGRDDMVFWDDKNCVDRFDFREYDGLLKRFETPQKMTVSGTTIDISGVIQMKVSILHTIEGDGSCVASLQKAYDCYNDARLCHGANPEEDVKLQEELIQMFEPYINSGAMSAQDLLVLKSYGYEVQY